MDDDRQQPPQQQERQPGREHEMRPRPDYLPRYPGAGRLDGKVALITGGDSGIGRAIAVGMAREGAKVAFAYLEEHEDARETVDLIEAEGSKAVAMPGDLGDEAHCREVVGTTVQKFGRLDILVNNAAEQHEYEEPEEMSAGQIERTFRTNVYSYLLLTKAALPHMGEGASIINTTSVTAYKGHKTLLPYSATRGAIVAYTRSLSQTLMERNIRVNAVAPGPIWTPLIPASFDPEHTAYHGAAAPMDRPGQPNEVASCHVFLASEEASYMSGQVLHPNGGSIVGS